MISLTSREEVLAFLQKYNSPLLQCEFVMSISPLKVRENVGVDNLRTASGTVLGTLSFGEVEKSIEVPDKVLLVSFDCPDSGIYWSPQSDKFGFVRAALKYSQLNIAFISPVESDSLSPIHKYYDNQFTESGLLKPNRNSFSSIDIMAMVGDTTYQLFHCDGCRFSYPIPQINLATAKATTYKTVISYNSFRYGV